MWVLVCCLGWVVSVRGEYITETFKVGSVEGPSINFVLDFGKIGRTYNSFPVNGLHSISDGETAFYEYLYVKGMETIVPVYFQLDTSGNSVGVLSMWNSNVSFCYQNYQTNRDSSLFLGQPCLDRHVFGGNTERYGPYADKSQMSAAMLEIIAHVNKTAIEYDPHAHPLEFKVYKDLPDVDNISTLTLPILLLVFLMAWLGWTKEISMLSSNNAKTDSFEETWDKVCSKYTVFIVDIITICVTTCTINLVNDFSMLRGGDAIQLVGIDAARRILEICWAGTIYVFSVIIISILAYGFTKTRRGQAVVDAYEDLLDKLTWWIHLKRFSVSGLCAVGAYFIAKYMEGVHGVAAYISISLATFVTVELIFYYDVVVGFFHAKRVFELDHREKQLILLFRWGVEIIVLTTLHASLPTTLNSVVSTTYRNGVGFTMGVILSMIGGRDVTWIVYYDMKAVPPRFDWASILRQAALYVMYFALLISTTTYISAFLLGPVFITSSQLEQESVIAVLLSVSIAVQGVAIGSIFAVYRIDTKAKTKDE